MQSQSTRDYPTHAKLTKSFFMSLPVGNFVVSLTFDAITGRPWFDGEVESLITRGDQWKRIDRSGAHQRNCLVYENRQFAEQSIAKMHPLSPENAHYDPFADVSFKDAKLSKKVLLNLKEGMLFMSRVILPDGSPEFSGIVSQSADREEQWKQLLRQGITQRRCYVFNNRADMGKYRKYMHKAMSEKMHSNSRLEEAA